MFTVRPWAPPLQLPHHLPLFHSRFSHQSTLHPPSPSSNSLHVRILIKPNSIMRRAGGNSRGGNMKTQKLSTLIEDENGDGVDDGAYEDEDGLPMTGPFSVREEENGDGVDEAYEDEDGLPMRVPFRGKEEERDYDRDPEFAEILGTCLDDPEKARSKMEDRLRKKRNKILHTKTGSATPMKVRFNKFDFSNAYIWFEFYHAPLERDIALICDAIRSWHIIGRLGGCNSMNMQLSQSPFEKRPNYDAIQGANVTPTTFYNIGDLELQDNLARIWIDIGTSEPLLLDILINALTQISSDYVGIKQVVLGGTEFEGWREELTTDDDAGYSVHKI